MVMARLAFLSLLTRADPNQIVLRIDPDPGLRLQLSALAEQSWRPVHLDRAGADVDLRIRLVGVGRLAHGLAGL
jgi:glucose-6-phosphate 1-dehydrogenase